MNIHAYVNKITKNIKCSGKRKKEIRKELLTDIECRIGQGEKLEDIISEMGTLKEIADTFNESMPKKEKQYYFRKRVSCIVFIIIVIVMMAISFFYWMMPKEKDIENSRYFDKHQIEGIVKQTVELLEKEDYDSLKNSAIEQMNKYLDKTFIDSIKQQISDDWGERKEFGTIYMIEMVQGNKHFVIAEIRVVYENVSVVYRLTYDQNMQLAGVYMR